MTPGLLEALQYVLLLLAAGGAALVVMARGRIRQVLALSLYGVVLAMAFLALQAPDVTLSEMVVGAVALPLILLLTIAKVGGAKGGGTRQPGPRE